MLQSVLAKLGFTDKASAGSLTREDWDKVDQSFNETYGKSLQVALDDHEKNAQKAAIYDKAAALLTPPAEDSKGTEASAEVPPLDEKVATLQTEKKNLETEKKNLEEKVEKMSKEVIPDNTQSTTMETPSFSFAHTATHAFGVANPIYSMDRRWNQIAQNPSFAAAHPLNGAEAKKVEAALLADLSDFGLKVSERYAYLRENNLLTPEKAAAVADFSKLTGAGLGDQFVIRQDALIARLVLMQQDVYAIFPRRYGVQDRELMTNVFIGELSAASQLGRVFKGSFSIEPEMGHVDKAMFKIQFESLQDIEKMYIGYLNTEGSNPVKWSLIEWLLMNMATKLVDEQKRRVIAGIYVKPETDKPGHFLHAGTGFIYTVIRYIHENKLLPFVNSAYNTYDDTSTVMVDAVNEFVADVLEKVESLDGKVIYLNGNHKAWWGRSYRAKYYNNIDFAGIQYDKVPDINLPIVWLQGMGKLPLMVIAQPGNFQAVENVPGEMFAVAMQQDMESVIAYSHWKEGFSASFVGRQFSTKALLTANDYAGQEVFCNYPFAALAADATTAAYDGKVFAFKTANNTAAKNFTDITGAKAGVAYIIECGGTTNATTVNKTGKFDSIVDNFVPTAVGDYLMVCLNTDGTKFRELERCVGGTRSINKDVQPNVPGGR